MTVTEVHDSVLLCDGSVGGERANILSDCGVDRCSESRIVLHLRGLGLSAADLLATKGETKSGFDVDAVRTSPEPSQRRGCVGIKAAKRRFPDTKCRASLDVVQSSAEWP